MYLNNLFIHVIAKNKLKTIYQNVTQKFYYVILYAYNYIYIYVSYIPKTCSQARDKANHLKLKRLTFVLLNDLCYRFSINERYHLFSNYLPENSLKNL